MVEHDRLAGVWEDAHIDKALVPLQVVRSLKGVAVPTARLGVVTHVDFQRLTLGPLMATRVFRID